MKRLLLPVLAFVVCVASRASAAEKPNILLIVADDLGWADVGWHGSQLKTPNLDKLVKEGVELDAHYVQPVCTPTRTALMSGRWTSRWGTHVLAPSNLRAFPPGSTTLAVALKEAGYSTHLAGKWHLGSKPEWGPNHYGFDHSYGSLAGAVDPWSHMYRKGPYMKSWHRDEKLIDEEGNATELVAKQAVEWIRGNADKKSPWFIYVPFQAVHIPIDAPEEYKSVYGDAKAAETDPKLDALRRYGGFVSQMDAKVAAFISALEEIGQRKNTLIVFTSDNGGTPALGNAYVGNTPPLKTVISSNKPLRGNKAQLYEGGMRVAAFANWPGTLAPRKVTVPMHAADWMPTLTKLAGYTPKIDLKWDGKDVWPFLSGAKEKDDARAIYVPMQGGAAVRFGEWKLISMKKGERNELYNIVADPYEKDDLAAREPAKLEEMLNRLKELRKDDNTSSPSDLKEDAE